LSIQLISADKNYINETGLL